MSLITTHEIHANGRSHPLLKWVQDAQHRHRPLLDAEDRLAYAKRIARVKDEAARELMLDLLGREEGASNRILDALKEFDTLHRVLSSIDAQLDSQERKEEGFWVPAILLKERLKVDSHYRISRCNAMGELTGGEAVARWTSGGSWEMVRGSTWSKDVETPLLVWTIEVKDFKPGDK